MIQFEGKLKWKFIRGCSLWRWVQPWCLVWDSGSRLYCIYSPCEEALWSAAHWSKKQTGTFVWKMILAKQQGKKINLQWVKKQHIFLDEPIKNFCCCHTSLAANTFFLTKSSAALKLSSTRFGSSEEIKAGWVGQQIKKKARCISGGNKNILFQRGE